MAYIDPHAHLRPTEPVAAAGESTVQTEFATHAVASMPARCAAGLIDLALIQALFFLMAPLLSLFLAMDVVRTGGTSTVGPILRVLILLILIAWWGPVTARNGGQSPGKRLMGLRVLREDGSRAPLDAFLLRETAWRALPFLVLPVPLFPNLWLAGMLAAAVLSLAFAAEEPLKQTWYDRLSRTVVVRAEPVPLGAPRG